MSCELIEPPEMLENLYVSLDVHEDIDGLYYTEYAQWDTGCAVRVYPREELEDPETGEAKRRPVTHGQPLMSLMTRIDARDRLPELLAFLLKKL